MIGAAELPAIVAAASRGDQRAWDRLVTEYTPAIKRVARRHGFGHFDQDDVVQRTWIALVHHIGAIREPASLEFWIKTTARRESLGILGHASGELLCGDVIEHTPALAAEEQPPPVEATHVEAVRSAASSLAGRQRDLVEALTAEPPLSYQQVSEKVGIPIGSIGPTRQRCIARLRRDPRIKQMLEQHPHVARPTRPLRTTPELV